MGPHDHNWAGENMTSSVRTALVAGGLPEDLSVSGYVEMQEAGLFFTRSAHDGHSSDTTLNIAADALVKAGATQQQATAAVSSVSNSGIFIRQVMT